MNKFCIEIIFPFGGNLNRSDNLQIVGRKFQLCRRCSAQENIWIWFVSCDSNRVACLEKARVYENQEVKVFIKLNIDNVSAGTIEITLYRDVAPRNADHFLSMCTNADGQGYQGSTGHILDPQRPVPRRRRRCGEAIARADRRRVLATVRPSRNHLTLIGVVRPPRSHREVGG